ncbi:MAG: hypothetical protein KDB82_11640 [Planctomycetes bacterium]|nr:hypothetical protein [Planctomycetota bacterium]
MRRFLSAVVLFTFLLALSACGGGNDGGSGGSGDIDVQATSANMRKIMDNLSNIAVDERKKKRLRDREVKDTKGARFYAVALKKGLLDQDLVSAFVVPGTDDRAANDVGSFSAANCSFCGPSGEGLMRALVSKGKARKVIVCPNAKHWKDFGDKVPLQFSDGAAPVLVGWRDLNEEFGITKADWENPASTLFGKKAPFDEVFE